MDTIFIHDVPGEIIDKLLELDEQPYPKLGLKLPESDAVTIRTKKVNLTLFKMEEEDDE